MPTILDIINALSVAIFLRMYKMATYQNAPLNFLAGWINRYVTNRILHKLLNCMPCLSVYVSLVFYLIHVWYISEPYQWSRHVYFVLISFAITREMSKHDENA